MLRAIFVFLGLLLVMVPAQARHHHFRGASPVQACIFTVDFFGLCAQNNDFTRGVRSIRVRMRRVRQHAVTRASEFATTLLPHPAGCPARAFCGCGAAAELGLHDRSLWLAASWSKFRRSAPGPNMAAYVRHHVMVLKQQVAGSLWLVADYNSGGHLSRLHVRDISRYTVVDPHS